MDQQANSSEVANVQVSSKTVIEKADLTEYKGKFDMLLMSGMAEAIKIWLAKYFFYLLLVSFNYTIIFMIIQGLLN